MKHHTARPTELRPLLEEHEAAPLLGTTVQNLRNCRSTGTGAYADVPHLKIGRNVRFDPRDLERWLEKRRRGEVAP